MGASLKRGLTPFLLFWVLGLGVGTRLLAAETNGAEGLPASEPSYGMVLKPAADLPGLKARLSIDLRDTNIIDVLKFLSQKSAVNIVASPGVDGRATLFLKDVTVEDTLQIVLISNGLAYRQHKNILYVMKEDEYVALYGETYRDQRVVRVRPLQFANPATVAAFLGNMKSTIGKIIVDEGTGTLVLIDVPEKIAVMEKAVKNLDIPTVVRQTPRETKVFELKYTKVADVQAELTKALTPAGRLQVDTKSNTLVVSDVENQMSYLEKVIRAFDRKLRQVFIEMKIIQIRLDDTHQMGVDWDTIKFQGWENTELEGAFPIAPTPTNFGRVSIGDLRTDGYSLVVRALQTFGDTETVAGPQLGVVEGQEATILIGTKEAYVTSTVSQASSTTTTSEDVTFVDVGVKLKVKPEINQDGFIKLTLTPEVSSVGRTLTTANGNEIPIVDTTSTTTTVLVKDGYTVLIGGLMEDDLSKSVTKFPVLGDIPWVGSIFRLTDDSRTKIELVIFLTPHLISGDEENPFLTASGKEFYSLRDLPSGKKPETQKKSDSLKRPRGVQKEAPVLRPLFPEKALSETSLGKRS